VVVDHRAIALTGADVENVSARLYEADAWRAAIRSIAFELRVEIEFATPVMALEGSDSVANLYGAVVSG